MRTVTIELTADQVFALQNLLRNNATTGDLRDLKVIIDTKAKRITEERNLGTLFNRRSILD